MQSLRQILVIASILWQPCSNMAQNLVKNYSFEDTVTCPVSSGELLKAKHWFIPVVGSSDYFHACSPSINVPNNFLGYQYAKTGEAYAGIVFSYPPPPPKSGEYVGGVLATAMLPSRNYCMEFSVSLANEARYAADRIGAHFFTDSLVNLPSDTILPIELQVVNDKGNVISDTMDWTPISGSYLATGGEKYVIIANFYPTDSLTIDTVNSGGSQGVAYYYIDDVFVRLMDSIPTAFYASSDTTICAGDSATIRSTTQAGYAYLWQGPGVNNVTASQVTVKPVQTSTYILTITDTMPKVYSCQATKTDTVIIMVIDCDTLPQPSNAVWLPNIFSPNGDGSNDVLYVRGSKIYEVRFTIYNRWGEVVFETTDMAKGWDGTYQGERVNDGVYVYRATGSYVDGTPFELKGNVTLVR